MVSNELLGSFILYLSCCLSSSGGIGGGGLNLPILLVIFQFKYSTAVVLSLCTVLGNYIAQFLLNCNQRHPDEAKRPLIYFDAALILLPAQLGGSNIGVLIAALLPTTIILIVAMFLLLVVAVKMILKGIKIWKKETKMLTSGSNGLNSSDNEWGSGVIEKNTSESPFFSDPIIQSQQQLNSTLGGVDYNNSSSSSSAGNDTNIHASPSRRLYNGIFNTRLSKFKLFPALLDSSNSSGHSIDDSMVDQSSAVSSIPPLELPLVTLRVLALVWCTYATLFVLMKTYVKPCSAAYFAVLGSTYIPLGMTVVWGMDYVTKKQRIDPASVQVGDIAFKDMSFLPPFLALLIGIMCALLGIGGGELMGPLLLSLKVTPQVSTATTSFMSLLNSASTILHYALVGGISPKWSGICFAVGFLGGLSGRVLALFVMVRYKRASPTVFTLATVLFISMCLLLYNVVTEESSFSLKHYC